MRPVALIALVVSGANVLGERLAAGFDSAANALSDVAAEEAPAAAPAEVPAAEAEVGGGAAAATAKEPPRRRGAQPPPPDPTA